MLNNGQLVQNRYRIVRMLAQGGMGIVYEAIDQRLNYRVALKQTLFGDPHLRQAFEHEAHLLANLRHPAIPKVTDHFTEESGQFLVMEFIAGPDLEDMLHQRNTPFPLETVLDWADKLLDALDYLHSQNPPVIHRDIKPQNIKIVDNGQVVLLDFGLAKGTHLYQTQQFGKKSVTGYTPDYAPLEQIQGLGTTPQSDLYALGATLYHLLTATPPTMNALTRAATCFGGETDPLPLLHSCNPHVPVAISTIIMQAQALEPADRPTSAAAMRHALHQAHHTSHAALNSSGKQTIVVPAPQPAPGPLPQPLIGAKQPKPIQSLQVQDGYIKRDIWDVITSIAFSPSMRLFAMAVMSKKVRILDLSNGQEVCRLKGHTGWWVFGSVNSVAFSPNGRILVTGGADKTVRLWDVATGHELQQLRGHTSDVNSIALSADGRMIASASDDETVRLWTMETGQERWVLRGHTSFVKSVAFSPNGDIVASAAIGDKTLCLWDARSGLDIGKIGGHTKGILCIAFSPDGTMLASASKDQTIRLWDVRNGHEVLQMGVVGKKNVQSLSFSPNGRIVASGGGDKTVRLWDVASGKEVQRLESGSGDVKSVTFSPNGHVLASGSFELRLWGVDIPEIRWKRMQQAWMSSP